MATDFEQIETDLETALRKVAASGIRSYQINGRMFTFNSPEELIKALLAAKAAKTPTGTASPNTFAEVVD